MVYVLGDFLWFMLVSVSRLMQPVAFLRIGLLHHRSIGRLVANTEYFLRKRAINREPDRQVIVLVSGKPVNSQYLRMLRRRVRVIESDFLWNALKRLKTKRPQHPLWLDLSTTGFYDWESWKTARPQVSFTENEHRKGRKAVEALGIPAGDPYVCLHARDKMYTDSPDAPRSPDDYWAYNDYRDCDIENCLKAAQYLAEKGLWVVRIGRQVEEAIKISHPRIIDYAGRSRATMKDSEFTDIYLQAHCKFLLGDGSGIYLYSSIFGVPVAYTNLAPLGECGRAEHDLFILKKYWNENEKRFVPFRDMIERGAGRDRLTYAQMDDFKQQGIEFIENTADEILALAIEMNSRLDGDWVEGETDDRLQDQLRELFPPDHVMVRFPGRAGADFLRDNEELLK